MVSTPAIYLRAQLRLLVKASSDPSGQHTILHYSLSLYTYVSIYSTHTYIHTYKNIYIYIYIYIHHTTLYGAMLHCPVGFRCPAVASRPFACESAGRGREAGLGLAFRAYGGLGFIVFRAYSI